MHCPPLHPRCTPSQALQLSAPAPGSRAQRNPPSATGSLRQPRCDGPLDEEPEDTAEDDAALDVFEAPEGGAELDAFEVGELDEDEGAAVCFVQDEVQVGSFWRTPQMAKGAPEVVRHVSPGCAQEMVMLPEQFAPGSQASTPERTRPSPQTAG